MKKEGVAALLVTRETDLVYLTGYTGEDSAALILAGKTHILTDRRFESEARREVAWARVWMRKGTLHQEIGKVCAALRLRKVWFQPDGLNVAALAELKKLCRPTQLQPAPPVIGPMRLLKDAEDLRCIRRAVAIAEDAFGALRKSIRKGQTELELAARLEYEMKRRGSHKPAFSTIIAEGPNAALPHARPGGRRVREGSAILVDWGARCEGYCSDLTRMIFIGSVSARFQKVYEAVLEAQVRAIEAVRPGARMCDVDAVARKHLADCGFGKRFTHGLGHGLGMEVHEPPSVSWRSDERMQPGMVVTIEPGVYLPAFGGVRIEDDVLVTPRGARVLTSLGKGLKDTILK